MIVRAIVAPVILVLVAVVQVALTATTGLTPWKGGGFGMFSTLDHAAFRTIEIVVDAPGRSETLEVAPSQEETAARAIACPADWLLRRLALAVVSRERRYGRPVDTVRIEVRTTAFATGSLRAEEALVRRFVLHGPR